MVQNYLAFIVSLFQQAITWMNSSYIVPGISLLHFIIAIALMCIFIGGVLIR